MEGPCGEEAIYGKISTQSPVGLESLRINQLMHRMLPKEEESNPRQTPVFLKTPTARQNPISILNGLAALCDFREITSTLVLDMFILHMNNKKVQEKLCTEPKEPDQTLEFAIAFEEGVKPQKAYGTQAPEPTKSVVKSKPVYAVDTTNPWECYKCGAANFAIEHVSFCMATNHRCKLCKIVVHVEKCFNKKFPQRQKDDAATEESR